MTYEEFLAAKLQAAPSYGFSVAPEEINPILKPHQRDIVRWAVRRGRAAIFAAFGLGKTIMQLECARILSERTGERFLIVAPLGVRAEFMHDAEMLGIKLAFVRSIEECAATGIYITNYETVRDGKMDPRQFAGVSLDEAGCLRGFGGTKTFRRMMAYFEGSGKYRIVATATPSPNDYIELLAYAAFLDVMDVSQGDNVKSGSTVATDEHGGYEAIDSLWFRHHTVNHGAGEFKRGIIHTNGIESVWSLLKRGIYGVWHQVSAKHLGRYVNEVTFRLNAGNVKYHTVDRLESFIAGVEGKRLTYKRLTA